MDSKIILNILRNPYGWTASDLKEAHFEAADLIEFLQKQNEVYVVERRQYSWINPNQEVESLQQQNKAMLDLLKEASQRRAILLYDDSLREQIDKLIAEIEGQNDQH